MVTVVDQLHDLPIRICIIDVTNGLVCCNRTFPAVPRCLILLISFRLLVPYLKEDRDICFSVVTICQVVSLLLDAVDHLTFEVEGPLTG